MEKWIMGIPSVDLKDFTNGNEEQRKSFVAALGKAYTDIGFVAVKNHLISDATIDELYKQVKQFFALADSKKNEYEIPGIFGQRGYTSFGKEHAKDSNAGDLKEFWHFGQPNPPSDLPLEESPANVLVNELPVFNRIGLQAFREFEETGKYMLRAIALFLNLEETYFDAFIHQGNSILRPIHYPPITTEPQSAVRSGQHEDINLITLLIGASAEGLQVLNKNNEWVDVTALPDHIVVNVGDMLQRHTNNVLKSTTHRVINPPRERWHEPRYSIPFFLHPRSDMRLDCIPSCVTDEMPLNYAPISAGDYLNERLSEIGLRK